MKLALGTVQFGLDYGVANNQGKTELDEAQAMLEYAAKQGIDTLDTAIAYGNSEETLGKIGVESWQVISKFPEIPKDCDNINVWMEETLLQSFSRLKVNTLYGLLLHRPLQLLEPFGNEIYQGLLVAKQKGLVQKIGISIYDVSELDALCDKYQFDLVQTPFNLLDKRLISSSWMSRLKEKNTEIHVRSIFLQGLLLMDINKRPEKFDHWRNLWTAWDEWLKESNLSAVEACIRYALSISEIDKVIVGADNLNQLKQIIDAANGDIPDVPVELHSNDINLLNPSRWNSL